MIYERLENIKNELNSFDDEFLKYSFLVELSAYVPSEQPDLMVDEHIHKGCQSRVWIHFSKENGIFNMAATSDTLIIRGVLYVMMELYNGLSTEEISKNKIKFLEECGIIQHFSSDRISGISGIADSIYDFCATP